LFVAAGDFAAAAEGRLDLATLLISDELLDAIDVAVREGEYADAAEYVTRLVRQDQKRRAKEALFASLATDGAEAGGDGETLAEAWREIRLERRRDGDGE
jgi:Arc/MetJ-type ribon-helix-helix transcriptional regulator